MRRIKWKDDIKKRIKKRIEEKRTRTLIEKRIKKKRKGEM